MPGSRDWPGQPDAPGQSDTPQQLRSVDRLAADDDPGRWSRDDLRHRLERLPPGHPSSLSADDRDSTSAEAEPDRQTDVAERSFWSEAPRFLSASGALRDRWPAEQVTATVDRSRDPAGSWRGDGGQYLNPKQHEKTEDVIAMMQQREETLTEGMDEAERDNGCGGWLEGLEHRLKGEDRLKEKIADLLETGAPDATTEEIVRQIPDAIRYTFCAESGDYKEVYWDIKERLQTHGHEMFYSENHWSGTQYKGINTRWITPEGQRFEVQFHTPESFYAKQRITHETYERLRNPLTQDDERQELMAFQHEVCSWITTPEGAVDIQNYRKEGH